MTRPANFELHFHLPEVLELLSPLLLWNITFQSYASKVILMDSRSNRVYRGGPKKGVSTRRTWVQCEEEVLMAGSKEIVVQGWKTDNGFKVGYLGLLEKNTIRAFLGTDLHADPHINSRIHVWKKNYVNLSSMLRFSGIGFNHTTNMIETHDEAWENYVKTDTNAHLMRYKCCLLYTNWIEVQSSVSPSAKKVRQKKRKIEGNQEQMYEWLGNYCKNTDSSLGEITIRIGVEYDVANAKKAVYAAINKTHPLVMMYDIKGKPNWVGLTYIFDPDDSVAFVINPMGDNDEVPDDGYESDDVEEFEPEYKKIMINGF
ncbi:hypothetical protein BUALT_Bualt13G0062700 [Buddleja alternifolia]|uniref:Myb/SANT-like domain-containing protein n=1 Tax=Buddleja alternifolia TaxID=168488 RepID=A0AAV6WRX9_9LAMI|nr:hypothetical protein BUALT_Bualt13G0062700 [Buddleja alternifolia]